MIIKTTTFTVYDVTAISVDAIDGFEPELDEAQNAFHRRVRITMENGEWFELYLYADEAKKLEFKNSDWLTPIVYKGKSMHEQELEENS